MPVETMGQRAKAFIELSDSPFGPAAKIIFGQVGPVVFIVLGALYEAPTGVEEIVPYAKVVARRAAQ